jgi:hypothetical protein
MKRSLKKKLRRENEQGTHGLPLPVLVVGPTSHPRVFPTSSMGVEPPIVLTYHRRTVPVERAIEMLNASPTLLVIPTAEMVTRLR